MDEPEPRKQLTTAEIIERLKRLPPMNAENFRADVDAFIDPSFDDGQYEREEARARVAADLAGTGLVDELLAERRAAAAAEDAESAETDRICGVCGRTTDGLDRCYRHRR